MKRLGMLVVFVTAMLVASPAAHASDDGGPEIPDPNAAIADPLGFLEGIVYGVDPYTMCPYC